MELLYFQAGAEEHAGVSVLHVSSPLLQANVYSKTV
jgi:hypothetical protein